MLLAALASAGIIGSAPAALFGRAPRELPPGRSFHEIRGEVTVDGDGANLRTEVRPGSVVATGAGAYAAFAVGDSAHILRANSRIELPGGGAARQALRVVTGALLSVFGKRKRRLETQVATIGIRGTGIYIEAEPDRSYICTCYGTADLSAADDPSQTETIVSEHHDAPRYILAPGAATNGARIRAAPFKNHDDVELALIEALVGREPPFSFSFDRYDSPLDQRY